MKQQNGFVGVDIIGNRYVLCSLDGQLKHPRYARGRTDTPKGQRKFFSCIGEEAKVIICEGELASLALMILGKDRVCIQEEKSSYSLWHAAGLERGEATAYFAAKNVSSIIGPVDLNEVQKLKILELQGKVMEKIQTIGDESQIIIDHILTDSATPKDIDSAFKNEYDSDFIENGLLEEQQPEIPSILDGDTSFLGEVYETLKDIK